MPTKFTEKALEKSTYVINAAFFDEDGGVITPNVLTWTLSDKDGNVINSRSAVSITPDTSIKIVLSGNDLATSTSNNSRIVTIKGTYDSTAGTDLPINDEVEFYIKDLVNV